MNIYYNYVKMHNTYSMTLENLELRTFHMFLVFWVFLAMIYITDIPEEMFGNSIIVL